MASNIPSASSSKPFNLAPKTASFRTCSTDGCKGRLAQVTLDPHSLCVPCRGIECSQSARCNVCREWDEATMADYLNHQEKLDKKRKAKKPASSVGSAGVPEPSSDDCNDVGTSQRSIDLSRNR